MQFSNEENKNLINQLDALFCNKPLFYLKFVKEYEYADELTKGVLYANTPEYYRQLEIRTGERGQGDCHELLSIIQAYNVQFMEYNSSKFVFDLPEAKVTFHFKSDNTIPMICFVGFTIKDLLMISANEKRAEFRLPFSDEELKNMKDRFGEYCVVFEPTELLHNIESYSLKNNVAYELKKITYCHQQTKERLEAFAKGLVDRFYYKDEDLSYQNEYRLIFDMNIPEDHKIRLESFSDNIHIVKCEDLGKNSIIINYDLKFI